MRTGTLKDVVLGFVAAAIAVVIVHQALLLGLTQLGFIKAEAWSTKPIPPWGVPTIVNSMFWGGLWGALFGLIHDKLPGQALWLKGLIYGFIVVIISNWTLLPLIKGKVFGLPNQVLFSGGDPTRMLAVLIILGGFGAALGVIFGLLGGRRR